MIEKLTATVVFARERLTEAFQAELEPLLVEHWQEIAHWKDIPLQPDWPIYWGAQANDFLRIFTFRDAETLQGYAVFFVRQSLHYAGSIQAQQDVLWLAPPWRKQMLGARFLTWCDEMLLRQDRVQVVQHHVKLAYDFGPTLVRLGYAPIETIYQRRLDKE